MTKSLNKQPISYQTAASSGGYDINSACIQACNSATSAISLFNNPLSDAVLNVRVFHLMNLTRTEFEKIS